MTRRGTTALESMILWGFVSIAIIVLFYGTLSYFNYQYRSSQAENTLRSVAITANSVYNLRPGSEETLAVEVPAGVTDARVSQNTLGFTIAGFTVKDQDIALETIPVLIGELPTNQGRHEISVKVLNETLVRIGSGVYIFTIMPPVITFVGPPEVVTLFGDEFNATLEVLVDGVAYPVGLVHYIDSNYVEFDVPPGQLPVKAEPYKISVRNPSGETSNSVDLTVI